MTSPWRAINDRNISIEPYLMCFKVEISTHDHTVHSAAILGNSVNNLAACFTCLIGSVCLSPRIVLWEWEMIHHILCIQHDPEVWIIKNHRTIFYLFIIFKKNFFLLTCPIRLHEYKSHHVKNYDLTWSAKTEKLTGCMVRVKQETTWSRQTQQWRDHSRSPSVGQSSSQTHTS